MDKKARAILFRAFWTAQGWKNEADRHVSPDDFAHAKAKGMMFDPVDLSQEAVYARLEAVMASIPPEKVTDAFLSSLSTKRLDWRSGIASYGNALHLDPPVVFSQDLNVLNFERHKWGGVRHTCPVYNMLDLELLAADTVPPPGQADIDLFRTLLRTIAASAPDDGPGTLRTRIRAVYKASVAEASTLLEILYHARILVPANSQRSVSARSDWGGVGRWRGADAYDEAMVGDWFGRYL